MISGVRENRAPRHASRSVSALAVVLMRLIEADSGAIPANGKYTPPIPGLSGTRGNGKTADVSSFFILFPLFPLYSIVGVYARRFYPSSDSLTSIALCEYPSSENTGNGGNAGNPLRSLPVFPFHGKGKRIKSPPSVSPSSFPTDFPPGVRIGE